MLRLSHGIEWLEDYVRLAEKYIPKIAKLTHIRKNSHRKNVVQRTAAKITYTKETREWTISLYVDYKVLHKLKPVIFMVKPYSKIDILSHLAHELAHMKHWKHTPKHKMLEAKLSHLFMTKLYRSGYSSEEDELKGQKGWRC